MPHGRFGTALGLATALAASQALAEEPDLRAVKSGEDVVIEVLPHPMLPVPDHWNLYRGALSDVAAYQQRGNPDGRCASPGDETTIPLFRETLEQGAHYYLVSAVSGPGSETGLGTRSDGVPRVNNHPCAIVSACGVDVIPPVFGGKGLAIAPDGTLYYAWWESWSTTPTGTVGRRRPGMAEDDRWAPLAGVRVVQGLALRGDGMLFAASPEPNGVGTLFRIDTTQASPAVSVLYSPAGRAHGIIIGPDGAVFYSDIQGGHVYRVDDAGVRTSVTTSTLPTPSALLFDDDGTLLVTSRGNQTVHRLWLDASGRETMRGIVGALGGFQLNGIAKDVAGRFYLSDDGGRRLLRTYPLFANPEVLLNAIGSGGDIAFGKGALECLDVYVASRPDRFRADVTGRP